MGVRVRQKDSTWWVFINHQGMRKAKKIGDRKTALEGEFLDIVGDGHSRHKEMRRIDTSSMAGAISVRPAASSRGTQIPAASIPGPTAAKCMTARRSA